MKKIMLMMVCMISLKANANAAEKCGNKNHCIPNYRVSLNQLMTDICHNYMYWLNPNACVAHYMRCIDGKLSQRILTNQTQGEKNAEAFRVCFLENIVETVRQ